jgi:copper(I)-binding protein
VFVKAVNHQSALIHQPARRRRLALAAIVTGVALVSSACAVGQHAATATDRPAIDGTIAQVGSIKLENISVQAPNIGSRPTGTAFYQPGDNAPMTLILVNNSHSSDTLTSVTGPFTSWAVVPTGSVADEAALKTGSTSQPVGPGGSVALGLSNLGVGTGVSPETLVLIALKGTGKLYPGSEVRLTFTFANAGKVTVSVPVQLSAQPNDVSVPAGASGA